MSYDFEHLVLLVGTNPLPNYVVGHYFLENNEKLKKIWLVHSRKTEKQASTEEIASNLRESFQRIRKIETALLPLTDIGSAWEIESEIEGLLINNIVGEAIHLDYTGGTKAMAVHVYMKIKERNFTRDTFSYLDARENVLKDDYEGIVANNLNEKIPINFKDLVELHGYEEHGSQGDPNWKDADEAFEEIIENGLIDDYNRWVKNFLTRYYYSNNYFIDNKNRVVKNLTENPGKLEKDFEKYTTKEVFKVLKGIPKEHSLLTDEDSIWIPSQEDTNAIYKNRLSPSIKDYLHGKWLESYVANILERHIEKNPELKKLPLSLKVSAEAIKKGRDQKEFEVDIVLINGYQLTGISITTSHQEGICKGKAFEILHRSKQMGGDEAKSIVITQLPKDKIRKFTDDIIYISGASKEQILILGKEDLRERRLWPLLKRHIWG